MLISDCPTTGNPRSDHLVKVVTTAVSLQWSTFHLLVLINNPWGNTWLFDFLFPNNSSSYSFMIHQWFLPATIITWGLKMVIFTALLFVCHLLTGILPQGRDIFISQSCSFSVIVMDSLKKNSVCYDSLPSLFYLTTKCL